MKLEQLEECLTLDTRLLVPEGDEILLAAVVLLFRCNDEKRLELLMIHRSEHPGDPWSGHMAFPGGRIDPEDDSTLAGAMRELKEELGIEIQESCLVGELEPMRVPAQVLKTEMWVRAFVFYTDDVLKPSPNAEVQGVYWFDFERFVSRENRGEFRYHSHGYDLMLPEQKLDGCHIWGMSLRLIDDLVERITCPWRDTGN